ncbi:hypothetical protein MAN_01541, partial [Metarhizium hybridum]
MSAAAAAPDPTPPNRPPGRGRARYLGEYIVEGDSDDDDLSDGDEMADPCNWSQRWLGLVSPSAES